MSVIRAFIAIDLPESIHEPLQKVSTELQEILPNKPIRWVPIPNIHLTLKFLGDVSTNNVDRINQIIKAEVATAKPFDISIGGFGVFPNFTRPRVIWVGVEAPDELTRLQRRLEGESARLGYSPDQREFMPHLTLGRVSRNVNPQEYRSISDVLRKQKYGFLGAARISSVYLFRSDLSPHGAAYTKVFSQIFAEN